MKDPLHQSTKVLFRSLEGGIAKLETQIQGQKETEKQLKLESERQIATINEVGVVKEILSKFHNCSCATNSPRATSRLEIWSKPI